MREKVQSEAKIKVGSVSCDPGEFGPPTCACCFAWGPRVPAAKRAKVAHE